MSRAQQVRLHRLYMAIATYSVPLATIYALDAFGLGHLPAAVLLWSLLATIVANALFYLLIRSGLSTRLRDPSLTLPQILFATVCWMGVPLYYLPDARLAIQVLYLMAFSFGMLRLNLWRHLLVVAVAVATYGAVLVMDYHSGRATFSLHREVFQLLLFSAVLLWFGFFGGFVYSLRQRLLRRNEALADAHAVIARQAKTDELTYLYNRRHAMEMLQQQKDEADRSGRVFSVGMIDIDHFKAINDRFGHAVGDTVLRDFAQLAVRLLRTSDMLVAGHDDPLMARYGGEEFMLILPATGAGAALRCLERLRRALEEESFPDGPQRVTLSAGVAEFRPGESVDSLLQRADEALYEAKQSGRNRICCHGVLREGARPPPVPAG